jgi:hypothetical protein
LWLFSRGVHLKGKESAPALEVLAAA